MISNARTVVKAKLETVTGLKSVANYADSLAEDKAKEIAKRLPACLIPPATIQLQRAANGINTYGVDVIFPLIVWVRDRQGHTELIGSVESLLEDIFEKLIEIDNIEVTGISPLYEQFPSIAYQIDIRYEQYLTYGSD